MVESTTRPGPSELGRGHSPQSVQLHALPQLSMAQRNGSNTPTAELQCFEEVTPWLSALALDSGWSSKGTHELVLFNLFQSNIHVLMYSTVGRPLSLSRSPWAEGTTQGDRRDADSSAKRERHQSVDQHDPPNQHRTRTHLKTPEHRSGPTWVKANGFSNRLVWVGPKQLGKLAQAFRGRPFVGHSCFKTAYSGSTPHNNAKVRGLVYF